MATHGDPLRVLVVDDEEELVHTLVERLDIRGYDADGVTNGHKALELIASSHYDVVLLDVKMPGLSGLQVMQTIKEKWPGIEVILLTGHGSANDAEEGMELGAFDYVMKPVRIENLLKILLAAVGREEGA
jgi:DNA-binding response OmpR family regulator